MAESVNLFNILVTIALILLVVVSGGVIYLSSLEWKDRRLQEREKRAKKINKG
jgi:hypothetical protein